MSVIEQVRALIGESRGERTGPAAAVELDTEAATLDPSAIDRAIDIAHDALDTEAATPDPSAIDRAIDIAHDALDEGELERTRREWAEPPRHR